MRIDNSTIESLHVHIHTPPSPIEKLLGLGPMAVFKEAKLEASARAPAIGQRWPGVAGAYAGVARGEDGGPDEHLVLLDARPTPECMQWSAGMEWAATLGDGAHLPTPAEAALLYAHVREHLDTKKWHWLSKQAGSGSAWFQFFNYGNQGTDYVSAEGAVRAVRRFAL